MRYWRLQRCGSDSVIAVGHAAQLVAAIGQVDANALAGAMLATLGAASPVCQCTIFAYEFGNRPRTLAVADRRGGRFLQDIAEHYARYYYALDGNQAVIKAAPRAPDTSIVLHRQNSADIDHAAYRDACYGRPHVSERVALLLQPAPRIWLSLNFYRDRSHGDFPPADIARLESVAPLLAQSARQHYALHARHGADVSPLVLARLLAHCPDLSKRELDVVRGVLAGHDGAAIAEAMGIAPSSVATYRKRAYRRLGIHSQHQLFALSLGMD